jgi:hypothetical protein
MLTIWPTPHILFVLNFSEFHKEIYTMRSIITNIPYIKEHRLNYKAPFCASIPALLSLSLCQVQIFSFPICNIRITSVISILLFEWKSNSIAKYTQGTLKLVDDHELWAWQATSFTSFTHLNSELSSWWSSFYLTVMNLYSLPTSCLPCNTSMWWVGLSLKCMKVHPILG